MNQRTLARWVATGAVAAVLAPAAGAQERGRREIPLGHLPPPGECRVWYDDRPPGQQPPPTSCGAARREAARTGARVVHGGGEGRADAYDRGDRRDRDRDDRRDRDRRDEPCADRNRDGRCDWVEGSGYPDRRYPDRRYPDRRFPGDDQYPRTLPETVWGVVFGRGDRLAVRGVGQWLGGADVRARYADADRDGRPEVVSWYDAGGTLVQRWIDDTRDGRADRVAIYQNGRVVRVIP